MATMAPVGRPFFFLFEPLPELGEALPAVVGLVVELPVVAVAPGRVVAGFVVAGGTVQIATEIGLSKAVISAHKSFCV